MKKCHKCDSKLDNNARFCPGCGSEYHEVDIVRKPEPDTPQSGSLVGDKNLINESTIIGKQEKYEASNITIHNTINEDHSHTTVVCAVSGKRIYMDHSVVCPKCGGQVALEYYVEISKRCENCEQKAREQYKAFVTRMMANPGPFDTVRKQQLDAEAQRLQIDTETQDAMLKSLPKPAVAGDSTTLSSVQQAELDAAVKRLISAAKPEQGMKSLETLAALHDVSSNYDVEYWYFLAQAMLDSAGSVERYEQELTDNYWQRYWGFLAYCNTGSPKGSAAVDRLRAVFGEHEDDIRLAETTYYLARGFESFERSMLERAGELSASIRKEYLSKPLVMIYDALQRFIRDGIQLNQKYSADEMFVFVGVFRAGEYIEYLFAEQARYEKEAREKEAREEQERQSAEKARRQKQAELSADRSKRMEQEMARLGGKSTVVEKSGSKAFAGYETIVPSTKKRNWGKIILIAVVCLIALIGILFLIPAPESLQ